MNYRHGTHLLILRNMRSKYWRVTDKYFLYTVYKIRKREQGILDKKYSKLAEKHLWDAHFVATNGLKPYLSTKGQNSAIFWPLVDKYKNFFRFTPSKSVMKA